jgi:predicted dienelactone hydrolase
MRRFTPLLLWLLLAGCRGPAEVELVLAPDPTATGEDGQRGPHGAARATYWTQGRVSDAIRFEATWPATDTGELSTGGPFPVVLSLHGGFVGPERYHWMADHMASRGYVVLAPKHTLGLAIIESDNASYTLDEVEDRNDDGDDPLFGAIEIDGPVACTGHSLGGTVSSMRWVADDRIGALGVFASYPPDGTDVESMAGAPSLLLTGSEDRIPTENFIERWERFPEPTWKGVVEGMNHYDWTDDASDADLAKDGVSTRPLDETRLDAWRVIDAWLDATLLDHEPAQARLDAGAFPGIDEVE